jgi:2-C-methyl-D-erythritol 4-phosphate cytidylyltransferase
VIKPSLLEEGFAAVTRDHLEVTDDVSIIEAIGKPVKMTKGSYVNIKVWPSAVPSGLRLLPA